MTINTLDAPLELAMQELEPLEAPGWATNTGRVVGATLVIGGIAAGAYT